MLPFPRLSTLITSIQPCTGGPSQDDKDNKKTIQLRIKQNKILRNEFIKSSARDFPAGPVGKTPRLQCRGPRVRSLVGELDPACMPQPRVHVLQLRSPYATTKIPSAAAKILSAATKTGHNQNK